jgi:hypothetical protein
MARAYTRREQRLLGEYLAARYPTATIAMNVRLGDYPIHLANQLPPNVPIQALNAYRRYVDAIVKLPDRVILVEAKITLNMDAAGTIRLYKELWPTTPEYTHWHDLPVEMEIVAAIIDPVIKRLAESDGVRVVQYSPAWLNAAILANEVNVGKLQPTPLPDHIGRS